MRVFGMDVVVMQLPTIKVQARIHPRKKRRLQKKWATRYGFEYKLQPGIDLESIFLDKARNVVYCYPQMVDRLLEAIAGRYQPSPYQVAVESYYSSFGRFVVGGPHS